jgi:MinD superfamily P-loop ATPase
MNIETKEAAIDFVVLVLVTPVALLSPDFKTAVELCERFNISAQDVLNRRKRRALHR